jgi:hypothetical protein
MYWENEKEKHLVLEFSDIRDGSRGKSIESTNISDLKKEAKDPFLFANVVFYGGKVIKGCCPEEEAFRSDIVLRIEDLRFDSKDKKVNELKLTDFKVDRKILERASSIVFVIPFKQRI